MEVGFGQEPSRNGIILQLKKIHIVAPRGRRKALLGLGLGLAMDVECYQMIFLYFSDDCIIFLVYSINIELY